MTWGKNEFGQLGNGLRDYKEKPRFNSPFSHRIIQIAAGSEHVIALSSAGLVLTWGGNRRGQLGDGQFTSRCVPQPIPELRHRPITSVVCGEAHNMALTIGGDVYSWGDNRYSYFSPPPHLPSHTIRSLSLSHTHTQYISDFFLCFISQHWSVGFRRYEKPPKA
jgi:alpha-tubulin suppressor-like RCC1 family protein